jgi:hypothetical protein
VQAGSSGPARLGSITIPWALGHISLAVGIRLVTLVPLAGAVLVTACALIVWRRTSLPE